MLARAVALAPEDPEIASVGSARRPPALAPTPLDRLKGFFRRRS
jgi:hypothetical protein